MLTDDSRVYSDLAINWLKHGIYGQTQLTQIVPTDARLPGYPTFLAGIFWLFGVGNFRAVLLTQILVDLGTCLIVADLARRLASDRAARIAFVLAALCPFLANYSAAVLTETLEIFFTALALDCAAAALNRMQEGDRGATLWAATGAAIAACILLRPDGGILMVAVVLYLMVADWAAGAASLNSLRKKYLAQPPLISAAKAVLENERLIAAVNRRATQNQRQQCQFFFCNIGTAVVVIVFALGPLVPWTIRNFRTLHHFQPLAPRYATDTDELVPRGFYRWVKTWIIDYVSVEEIYWNVPGDRIDATKLPSRAFDSPAERDDTLAVIADYNQSHDMTPELDARFGRIAADRVRAHPIRYYALLPLLRIADMWLRPRTEILPPDPRWWEFNDDAKHSVMALGFGVLNLGYVAAALLAVVLMLVRALAGRPSGLLWAGLLVSFLLLRSAFLGTLENPEPRYTLECYPVIIVLASVLGSVLLAGRFGQSREAA